jgi:hypothetical protein
MFNALSKMHARQVAEAQFHGRGEETLAAWHAHLPSGQAFRIKWIRTHEPFMRFTGLDDETFVLMAPEAVAITCTPVPPESNEPRVSIGFIRPGGTPDDT